MRILIYLLFFTLLQAQHRSLELDIRFMPTSTVQCKVFFVDQRTSMPYLVSSGTRIEPGEYIAILEAPGYERIEKKIVVAPDDRPYRIRETLHAKKRRLAFRFYDSADNQALFAQSLLINGTPFSFQSEFKAGEKLNIQAKFRNYPTVTVRVEVMPGNNRLILHIPVFKQKQPVQLLDQDKSRMVHYQIISDFDRKKITPDWIQINGKKLEQNDRFAPGKYSMGIIKRGYFPIKRQLSIEPGAFPYHISEMLIAKPRRVQMKISGDFPADEPLDPFVVSFNDQDVRDHTFKPGRYILKIRQAGFISCEEDVIIPPGETPFVIEKTLIAKHRKWEETISYDVDSQDLPPHTVTLTSVGGKLKIAVQEGDSVKPGEYIMKISRKGYHSIEVKKYIWPSPDSMKVEAKLIAKKIRLKLNIVHDVKPSKNNLPYIVSLSDSIGMVYLIKEGMEIKPGTYSLRIEQPGYTFGAAKKIYIAPGEYSFEIREKLLARRRAILFHMVEAENPNKTVLASASQIVDNLSGKNFANHQKAGGSRLDLSIKFQDFQTVDVQCTIPSGEGPYIIKVPLVPLSKKEFFIRKSNYRILDGIKYPYLFFVDGKPVETHHVQEKKGKSRYFYALMLNPKAKELKITAGYQVMIYPLDQKLRKLPPVSAISVSQLIEHLAKIEQESGKNKTLEILHNIVAEYHKIIAANKDKKQLVSWLANYLENDALRENAEKVLQLLQ